MKDNTKKTLSFYFKSITTYKWWVFFLVFSIMGGAVTDSIVPIYLKRFFNILVDGGEKSIVLSLLLSTLSTIIIFKFLHWLFGRIVFFIMNSLEPRVIADLNKKCFEYLHKHSFSYFSNTFTGSVVKKVKGFVRAFEVLADQFFFELFPGLITVLIITIILGQVNVFLGLGMFLWVILFAFINWLFSKHKIKYDIDRSKAETKVSSYLADTVSNNTNIKLFNGYFYENKGFSRLVEKLRKLQKFTWDLGLKFYSLQSFLLLVLEIGMLYFAIRLWGKDMLTVGDFVLIQSYIVTVMLMVWNFGRMITRIYENLAEAEEMTILLNTKHEIVDVFGARKLIVDKGDIEFKNLVFAYDDNDINIFNNFSLNIKKGQTIALVGSSGSGKTTLVKLLLRLYDLKKGKILIDGQDISLVTQESLRENISLVPQDPILFHRSLMENIRYGKIDASDEEVVRASKLAHCHEFISELKLGYKTFVGERGIKLSGGERQRVAIARAILRNAPILVLDEATSSLDSESEKFIQDSLDKLMRDKTVIVIAHRLSTIKKADRIVVIDDKKIVEDGDHGSLIKLKDGKYQKLWGIQVGGFIK